MFNHLIRAVRLIRLRLLQTTLAGMDYADRHDATSARIAAAEARLRAELSDLNAPRFARVDTSFMSSNDFVPPVDWLGTRFSVRD